MVIRGIVVPVYATVVHTHPSQHAQGSSIATLTPRPVLLRFLNAHSVPLHQFFASVTLDIVSLARFALMTAIVLLSGFLHAQSEPPQKPCAGVPLIRVQLVRLAPWTARAPQVQVQTEPCTPSCLFRLCW